MIGAVLAVVLAATLSRQEILERMKAPILTQADGLVKVFADCPEDMRREFQQPVARYAGDTMCELYQGLAIKPIHFNKPGIVVHIGDVRTNLTAVTTKVETNDARILTRIYLKSPGYADLDRFKLELIKAFARSVQTNELDDAGAIACYRRASPSFRAFDERNRLEQWLTGRYPDELDDEEGFCLLRKVIEPGKASRRDILTFASRLYLYPIHFGQRFLGRYTGLSFRDAVKLGAQDGFVRLAALKKADEVIIFGGGRGEKLARASRLYRDFLLALAKGEESVDELEVRLEAADTELNVALEEVTPHAKGQS